MKAKRVLKLLKITRPTLSKYVKIGRIKASVLPNGFYDYDEESVYKSLNKKLSRKSVLYCRVSTNKQKKDLENQEKTLKDFCTNNGVIISDIYRDIGSGINFDRKEFQRLLKDIISHKVNRVYITYKDRLSRISYPLFENLFDEFNCKIIPLIEIDNEKLIEKEIINEIVSLIHSFSMKLYSNRRKEKLKLIEKDLKLELKND